MTQSFAILRMVKLKLKNYFCYKWILKSLGIKSNYNFPITLTASMTRSLTNEEFVIMVSQKSGEFYL